MTNYINADGTSRAIAVFTARLSPLRPAGRTTSRAVSKIPCGAVRERGRDRRTAGRGEPRDYWAPKPRITGITPRIRNRARGRQSATVLAVPSPLARQRLVVLSFHPAAIIHRLFPRALFRAGFDAKPRRPSRRFSSRYRGNLQITIMEEKSLGEKRSAMLLESRLGAAA